MSAITRQGNVRTIDLQSIRMQHRKYLILRALYDETDNRLNERVIADVLNLYAVGGTRDDLRSACEDLMREGFLEIVVVDDIQVLSLTLRGAELVERKVTSETIYRPGPGERY